MERSLSEQVCQRGKGWKYFRQEVLKKEKDVRKNICVKEFFAAGKVLHTKKNQGESFWVEKQAGSIFRGDNLLTGEIWKKFGLGE